MRGTLALVRQAPLIYSARDRVCARSCLSTRPDQLVESVTIDIQTYIVTQCKCAKEQFAKCVTYTLTIA